MEQGRLGARPQLPLRGVRRLVGAYHARVPLGPPSPSAVEPCFRSAVLSVSQPQIRVITWSTGATVGRRRASGQDNVAVRGVARTALQQNVCNRMPPTLMSTQLWSTGVES
ncbi:unnamed protein product [Urochloa humidicola]